MLSKKNKALTIKVSVDTYNFLKLFSKKYNCSVSSLCQDFIARSILYHDSESRQNPDLYYKNLSRFINKTYDERRK